MVKKAALIVGIVFVVIGVAGFIPGLTVDSEGMKKLLGLFMVDGTHNAVHLLSGLVFLAASRQASWSRLAFQVFGVVYALVTIIGFISGNIVGLFEVNTADNILHVLLVIVFLYFGFAVPERESANAATPAV